MDKKERFFRTIAREKVDYPASWLGLPDAKAEPGLMQYFGVNSIDGIREIINDDIYPVELPYHSPSGDAIYMAFDFARQGKVKNEHRTLNAPGFFEDVSDPTRIEDFDWPDPANYIDPEECRAEVSKAMPDRAVVGIIWSSFFQDTWAAFGMENGCIQMMMAPDMFQGICDRIVDFYLKANEIFFESTRGMLDAVLIGNDYGAQTSMVIAPEQFRQFGMAGTKQLVDQAHAYDLKVIHHSCGSIYEIIPDLIEAGVDAIHPMQALATNMEAEKIAPEFGDKVSFVGGLDAQHLLVQGMPEQIKKRVHELRELFPTGLVISPSHEAILEEVNPENIKAMFEAVQD
ncbi:MAG: methyltransferase [Calditrichaeota bacterium]|nr:MAG: methyltransferase [Calditrichota bacterium]